MISSNTLLNLEATVLIKSKRPELTAMSKVLNINVHNLSNHDLVVIPEQIQQLGDSDNDTGDMAMMTLMVIMAIIPWTTPNPRCW